MRRWTEHFPEYAIEAVLLGLFMMSACSFGVLLEHPDSPVHQALMGSPFLRRALMGLAMGSTAVAIIYSPWGGRSGAHINPATTLVFYRLGRIGGADAAGYMVAQFLGAVLGVVAAGLVLGARLAHPNVHYVVTRPGMWGQWWAFAAEVAITALLMATVVAMMGSRHARRTGLVVGLLIALYITFEAPISGMSMNPARTFGSAWGAGEWDGLWLYAVAPLLGMNIGAWLATWARARPACPKLNHPLTQRCIFCGHVPATAVDGAPREARSYSPGR